MSSPSYDPREPQDRLPDEPPAGPAARFEMPVLGGQPQPPVPRVGGTASDSSLVAVFGDVHREGRWTLAAQTSVVPVFGDVTLDLREASLEAAECQIRAYPVFGDVTVIVPPGVDVQVAGMLVFGDRTSKLRTPPAPDAPRVHVLAYGAFGDVKVLELAPGESRPSWKDRFRRQ